MSIEFKNVLQKLQILASENGVNYADFDTTWTPSTKEARLGWDDETGTLQLGLKGGTVSLSIGSETMLPRAKAIGSNILNGQAVYVSGASGVNPHMSLARADALPTSQSVLAIATEDISENNNGFFTAFGLVRDVDSSAFSEGDMIYLSPTISGGLTSTAPSSPNYTVCVGFCTRSHATEGVIFINIRLLFTLFSRVHGLQANSIPFADANGFLTESANLSYIDNKLKVGTATDYTEIEADGTIISYGAATCWDDIALSATSLGVGATAPDLVDINSSGIFLRAFAGTATTEQLFGAFEIPHTYSEGTDLVPHVHWMPTTTGAGSVKFLVDYWRVTPGSTAPSTPTTISTTGNTDSTAWESFINSTEALPGTGVKIGDQIAFRLYRDPAQDTYADDAAVLTFGIHYQINSLGSRLITTK